MKRLRSRVCHEYRRVRAYLGRPRIVEQVRPVLVSEESRCESPIFIIGVHRSGTSLVRRILNSHSHIACPPETYFLAHFAAMLRDNLTSAGFQGIGFDEDQVPIEIGIWASRYHEAYRLACGKVRWADKTPQYTGILPELEKMFGPSCRYVMVFRHPLDVVYSQWKRGWRFGDYHPDLLLNNAEYVSDSLGKMLAFRDTHATRCHTLYYERLVSAPQTALTELIAFLGEPWEEEILRYYEKPHGFGTEDPVVLGTRGFVKNFGNWQALSAGQTAEVAAVVRKAMESLGYSMDSDFPWTVSSDRQPKCSVVSI